MMGGPSKLDIVPSLSVQDGIQAARLMLPRVWFDSEKCGEAVETLKQYQREWDEDKKVFRERPRHDFSSHCADALRMLALSWRENKQKEPEKVAKYPVTGHNGRIVTIPLDDLWNETSKRNERY